VKELSWSSLRKIAFWKTSTKRLLKLFWSINSQRSEKVKNKQFFAFFDGLCVFIHHIVYCRTCAVLRFEYCVHFKATGVRQGRCRCASWAHPPAWGHLPPLSITQHPFCRIKSWLFMEIWWLNVKIDGNKNSTRRINEFYLLRCMRMLNTTEDRSTYARNMFTLCKEWSDNFIWITTNQPKSQMYGALSMRRKWLIHH
jgi:hypothetical protein